MAHIPAEELERLKAQVPVERLVAAAGVALKAAGKDLLGRCPFHEDREASLVVTPAKNLSTKTTFESGLYPMCRWSPSDA